MEQRQRERTQTEKGGGVVIEKVVQRIQSPRVPVVLSHFSPISNVLIVSLRGVGKKRRIGSETQRQYRCSL